MSAPGLRENQKAANRAAILKAATEVFSELGFEACTVRDIVRASGLAAGTFYNYFESKEQVLESMITEIGAEVRTVVHRARRKAVDGRSFIEDGYLGFFQVLSSDPGLLLMLARNQNVFRSMVFGTYQPHRLSAKPSERALEQRDVNAVQGILADLKKDLKWAFKKGYFREANPELLSRAMIGSGFEILVSMGTDPALTPEKAAEFLTDLFFSGLAN